MQFKDKHLDLTSPQVMGILNVTPDSFSDGGKFKTLANALKQTERMINEGASFIDVGGESTRPGASDVSEAEELDRVVPVISEITKQFDVVVSIDTSKAVVMREAVNAGAGLINDVRALREPNALKTAAVLDVPVCLMHMQGQPRTMQDAPEYNDVTEDVIQFLRQRMQVCLDAGINLDQIIVDPGFGFGKSLAHNYQLLAELEKFHALEVPVLAGLSRKSMLGKLLNRETEQRLAGSLAGATICALKGAQIIRVHDVKETVDAVKVVSALNPS